MLYLLFMSNAANSIDSMTDLLISLGAGRIGHSGMSARHTINFDTRDTKGFRDRAWGEPFAQMKIKLYREGWRVASVYGDTDSAVAFEKKISSHLSHEPRAHLMAKA